MVLLCGAQLVLRYLYIAVTLERGLRLATGDRSRRDDPRVMNEACLSTIARGGLL